MSTRLSSLDLVPSFHAVMTHGSLSAAARHLALSQPTVRRHVETLEQELNTPLFTRAANGLTPTDMAHALFPSAEAVLGEARALTRAASGKRDALDGVVRLTCSRIVATHVLPPLLGKLRRQAPGLRLEIAATDREENLARRAADIAVRFAQPAQQALVAARLPDVQIGLFTAPDGPVPAFASALSTTPFVTEDAGMRTLDALQAAGLPRPEVIALRCDDPLAQIAAVQAGLGVGVVQVKLASRLGLHRVLPEFSHAMPAWLVVHEDQARIMRIAHVFAALKAGLPEVM